MQNTIKLEQIKNLEDASYRVIEMLRQQVYAPSGKKTLERRFQIGEAAELCGRSTPAIRMAEAEGRLPPAVRLENNRRAGYTLENVNNMRRVFGTMPHRADTDEPLVLAVQNFKGGVGKSTISCHLAQHLALKGYRVCVIDCDPQASTTSLFGINPDYELEEDDTLTPFLEGSQAGIRYALRDTYWDQLKLIPANLGLYQVEYLLAASLKGNAAVLDRLRVGITEISNEFDVILIDPPPALGMISLSVLRSASALIVPTRPATIDFGSTAHFFTMLHEALGTLEEYGYPAEFKFMKVLVNDLDEGKTAHREITNMMRQVFDTNMLRATMKDSAEIDNACGRMMTVYELTSPITTHGVHSRAKTYLNAVNNEIELLIRQTWPSQIQKLREEGVI